MNYLFAIITLIVGCLFFGPASADDLITSRAILEDVSGTLAIDDVTKLEASQFNTDPVLHASRVPRWVQLRVRAPAEGDKVVLFIRPTFLNDVRLFQADPSAPGGWKSRETGTNYPFTERDRQRVSLGFVIDVTEPEETVYLRIVSRHYTVLNVEALTPAEAEKKDFDRDLLLVFFVTTMSVLLIWAIHSYLLDKQKVFAFFSIHQLIYTLFGISITGYFAPFIPDQFSGLVDFLSGVLYILIGLTMSLFCHELLKAYDPPRAMRWLFWALISLFVVNCLAFIIGYRSDAIFSNAIATKLMLLYFVTTSFQLRTEGTPRRALIQFFFCFILINNMAFWIPTYLDLNVAILKWSGIQVLFIDGFLIACLFAVMAYVRARSVRREAAEAAQTLAIINRNLQEEKERKDQAEAEARTDYLTGLFNRRHFFELAQRELERSTRFQRPLTLLMIDIDHFKSINDTWGHGFGDLALRSVADILRSSLRNIDIFGRTGGEEFAAVIVETVEAEAVEIAQRLRRAVEANALTAPDGTSIQVTVSIGLTHLRGRQVGFDNVMSEADQAMYAAKKAGRNKIMVNA